MFWQSDCLPKFTPVFHQILSLSNKPLSTHRVNLTIFKGSRFYLQEFENFFQIFSASQVLTELSLKKYDFGLLVINFVNEDIFQWSVGQWSNIDNKCYLCSGQFSILLNSWYVWLKQIDRTEVIMFNKMALINQSMFI